LVCLNQAPDISVSQSTVEAPDGYRLSINLFEPNQNAQKARGGVLIAPAMGTPQSYYGAFARWLAGNGFITLTFDYRGTGSSLNQPLPGFDADILSWARDTGTALAALSERAGSLPIILIGHSLGGQIVPLVPGHESLARIITIAAGSGYWRDNAPKVKWGALLLWHFITPVVLPTFRYFPGKRLKIVGDLPQKVMEQWRRWCLNPEYLVGVEGAEIRQRFEKITTPVVSISFSDDELMSNRGIEVMHSFYRNAPLEMIVVHPHDHGLKRIGHFGFFRKEIGKVLWNDLILSKISDGK
jgi:predicted alpha/beta hydrolase